MPPGLAAHVTHVNAEPTKAAGPCARFQEDISELARFRHKSMGCWWPRLSEAKLVLQGVGRGRLPCDGIAVTVGSRRYG